MWIEWNSRKQDVRQNVCPAPDGCSAETGHPAHVPGARKPALNLPPRRPGVAVLLAVILVAGAVIAEATRSAQPAKQPEQIHKPNIHLYLYRRNFTPDEPVSVRISTYNLHSVRFRAYRLNLPDLLPNSRLMINAMGAQLKMVTADHLPAAAQWQFKVKRFYPDQWAEDTVKAPRLGPGVYLIQAEGSGVEKRTWLAVTPIALFARRSLYKLIVYAANATTGRPVSNLLLTTTDDQGRHVSGRTDNHGLWQTPTTNIHGYAFIYGQDGDRPAFVQAYTPPSPQPYAVYAYTDRPIYRPGQNVLFTGTVRAQEPADVPGGLKLSTYANKTLMLEVRDPTDALVQRRISTTDLEGRYHGSVQLASGAATGSWSIVAIINQHRFYSSFQMMAYRKPEFTVSVEFDRSHYQAGSVVPATITTDDFFGTPVRDALVAYSVTSYESAAAGTSEGQGFTNSHGKLHLFIRTHRVGNDTNLTVSATVTDLSRRSHAGSGSVLLTAGAFSIHLTATPSTLLPGQTVTARVTTQDYDSHPVSVPVKVALQETMYDRKHRPYIHTTTRQVTTSAAGTGETPFVLPRPGELALFATAVDSQGNVITSQTAVTVVTNPDQLPYPTLELSTDRSAYQPGQVAAVTLKTSLVAAPGAGSQLPKDVKRTRPVYHEAWALVTVLGERIYQVQTVHLTGRSTVLHIPVTEMEFQSVQVEADIIQNRQLYSAQATLSAPLKRYQLQVAVSSSQARYQPGQPSTWTVNTKDWQGHPVPAAVSLQVVDASIYALAQDNTPDPSQFFHSGQEDRESGCFSFDAIYSGGGMQAMSPAASGPAPRAPGGIRLRKTFRDTAFWSPTLVTDAAGRAQVTFALPDNLTTWRATARAITADTAGGQATHDVVVSLPLMVRLETPRFYVDGDHGVLSAIVQNESGAARTLAMHAEATGATLEGNADQTISLPTAGQKRIDWKVTIHPSSKAGPAGADSVMWGAGTVRFLVSADGGKGARDAMQLILPVDADGLPVVTAHSWVLGGPGQVGQPIPMPPAGGSVTITLAPSLVSAMLSSLQALQVYPYGCAEQTASSFLPDVAMGQVLRRMGSRQPAVPRLQEWVSLGLQKLYNLQHPDGGWNWWSFDQTDGDMTAYVLTSLAEARGAGFLVDDQRITRGAYALQKLIQMGMDPAKKADWMLALSVAKPDLAAPLAGLLYVGRGQLDIYGQASLALALANLAHAGSAASFRAAEPQYLAWSRALASHLEMKATLRGTLAFWPPVGDTYTWRGDDVTVTAHVLRAIVAANPHSRLIPGAVAWLMGNREGAMWSSTRSTSEALLALSAVVAATGEMQPNYTARVLLDGQPVQSLQASPASIANPPMEVTFTPALLAGHKTLTVEKNGPGTLYITARNRYLAPPAEALQPGDSGITVHRWFELQADDPTHANVTTSGMDIIVHVQLTTAISYRYVLVEDPLPAGCEVGSAGSPDAPYPLYTSASSQCYAREDVRDDRVLFYLDDVPAGRTELTYQVHAETPGLYHILPDTTWLMYAPEVRGHSGLVGVQVGENPELTAGAGKHPSTITVTLP